MELFKTVTTKYPEVNILINNAGILKTINLQEAGPITEVTQ